MVKIREERKIAIEILSEFEELLQRKDIKIPSDDRETEGEKSNFILLRIEGRRQKSQISEVIV